MEITSVDYGLQHHPLNHFYNQIEREASGLVSLYLIHICEPENEPLSFPHRHHLPLRFRLSLEVKGPLL